MCDAGSNSTFIRLVLPKLTKLSFRDSLSQVFLTENAYQAGVRSGTASKQYK